MTILLMLFMQTPVLQEQRVSVEDDYTVTMQLQPTDSVQVTKSYVFLQGSLNN